MRTGDIFGHVFMWCKMHIFISVLLPRHLRILQERKNLDWKKGTVSFSYFSFSSSKMDDMSAFIAHNAIFILFGLLSLTQAALDSAQLMNAGTEKHLLPFPMSIVQNQSLKVILFWAPFWVRY